MKFHFDSKTPIGFGVKTLAVLFIVSSLLFSACGGDSPPSPESIAISSSATALLLGETVQLTATGTYAGGTTSDITSLVTWASDTSTVASVSTEGLVTGSAHGSAGIFATLGSITSPPLNFTVHSDSWTWFSGSDTVVPIGPDTNSNVSYGTKGVPAASNLPGAREGAVSWTDANGDMWMFGGFCICSTGNSMTDWTNDLWKYDIATGMWTWVSGSDRPNQPGTYGTKGTPSAANTPGSRYDSLTWVGANGNLWLFGGSVNSPTYGIGGMDDLWKFDLATSQWTWISGSNTGGITAIYGTKGTPAATNTPGDRIKSVTWTDTGGNMWLFGGSISGGTKNDIWKFDPALGQWTWVSGPSTNAVDGVYGTKGTPAAANMPGARDKAISWVDTGGNLWLFGGEGYDSAGTWWYLNDLWKYDIVNDQWTWVSGADTVNAVGVYGTKGTPAATNIPGARVYSASWKDSGGSLWLFGGAAYSPDTFNLEFNDLWKFDIANNQWTWVSGSDTTLAAGTYGTKGTPAATNIPGARQGFVSWTDAVGNLWLFGGKGHDSAGTLGALNDLWRYITP